MKKPSKRGLTPYYGEFLISPIPLELSGNHCSTNCSYCFANLNQPGAIFDEKATLKLINNCDTRKSLPALLLQQKYPVLLSNRSDPFAESNVPQFVPLMRLLTDLGIPISIQTRGGNDKAIKEALTFLRPSVWYISMPHQDDVTREKVERYAPTVQSRFELIQWVRDYGHRVLIGLNPLVREWVPRPMEFLVKMQVCGVEGVWMEPLHLTSHVQRGNMLSRDKKALGEDLIKRARSKILPEADVKHFLDCRELCQNIGLESYSIGQPFKSEFFKPFYEVYPKTFPNNQGFVNHCIDNNIQEFGFEEWFAFFENKFPEFDSAQISLFLYTTLRYNRRDCHTVIAELGRPRNYLDLLMAIWNGQKFSPQSSLLLGSEAFELLENGRIKVHQD